MVPTCDSVHSWQLYSAVPMGYQAASTMIQITTQSNYPNTGLYYNLSLPYPNNVERQTGWQQMSML